MAKSKNIRLNLDKRKILATLLERKESQVEIAETLGYSPSSILREVKKYRVLYFQGEKDPSICSRCLNNATCTFHNRCGAMNCNQRCCGCKTLKVCSGAKLFKCKIENKYPFVCVKCDKEKVCMLNHYRYDPFVADEKAQKEKRDSRVGLNFTPDEFDKLNIALKSGFDKGQSLTHIAKAYSKEINRTSRTLYYYVNKGLVSVKRIDLPRAVSLKKRKSLSKKYEYNENKNIDRGHRMFSDWLVFQVQNKIINYWQMDFLGAPHGSEQEILLLSLAQLEVFLFFALTHPTKESVVKVFDYLEEQLGDDFNTVFPAILTDRDTKFNSFKDIEINKDGVIRTRVFFCNPAASTQKPNVENNNQQIRTTFPKGEKLNGISQELCNTISSNYNSRYLNSIDGKRPIDLLKETFGEKIVEKLGLKEIPDRLVKIKHYKKY